MHVDAYRLSGLDEVDDLDLDVDLADSVTVVEWGAGLVDRLADSYLEIQIERDAVPAETLDAEVRTIRLVPHGRAWADRIGKTSS